MMQSTSTIRTVLRRSSAVSFTSRAYSVSLSGNIHSGGREKYVFSTDRQAVMAPTKCHSGVTLDSLARRRFLSTSKSDDNSGLLLLKDSYENILVEISDSDKTGGSVGIITLHRPKALNALSDALLEDLIHAARAFDKNPQIGCMVVTGSHKAFAAGADISEMATRDFATAYKSNMFARWADVTTMSKPIIAAVNGFALGGGDKAKFGQPEINLGVIPGAGGTQRLVRAIGKSKAMELVLTGGFLTAQEAVAHGLAARLFPADSLVQEAIQMGHVIASKGHISVLMAKEAINAADEMTLQEGLRLERRLFHSLFATNDQKESDNTFFGFGGI
eukprot:scaffold46537_cov44-Attheya_sp.AAC.1